MQILSLELENSKSYLKSTINFTAGINAIVGHNGAGKSTIVEAIGFVLFDSISYRQSDFVREDAKSATIAVTLLSSFDKRQYQVIRRCGSSNQYHIFDPDLGIRICEGKADVLAFLKEHMGVEPMVDLSTLFHDAVGVPQGTLTAAFLQTASARKGTFDTLLRVDEYRQVSNKLLEPSRLLGEQLQALEVNAADLRARLERLPLLESAIEERKKSLVSIEEKVAVHTTKLGETEQKRQRIEAKKREIEKLQKLLMQAEQRLQSLAEQKALAEKALAEATKARHLLEENRSGFETYQEANARQEELQNELQRKQTLEAEYSRLDKALSLQQAELARLQQALADSTAAQKEIESLAEAVAKQERLEEQRSLLQQEQVRLQEIERTRATLLTNQQALEDRLSTLRAQLATGEELETERTEIEKELLRLHALLPEQQQAFANFEVEAKAAKEQNVALENAATATCPVCEQTLTPEHREKILNRNRARLESMRREYAAVRQKIKEHEAVTKQLQTRQRVVDEQIRQLPRSEEVKAVEKELDTALSAIEAQDALLSGLTDLPQRMQQLNNSLASLGDPKQRVAILQTKADSLTELQSNGTNMQKQILSSQEDLSTLGVRLESFAELDDALSENRHLLQKHERSYQLVLSYRQAAESVEERSQLLKELDDKEQALATEVAEHQAQIADVEIAFDADEYQQVLQVEQTLRGDQARLEQQLAYLRQEQDRDAIEVEKLQAQKRKLTTIEEEMQEIEQKKSIIEMVRSLFRQAGPHITKSVIDQVSIEASQIFSELMSDYSRRLHWTEDYGIRLEVDGRERHFSQLSGGEQMSAALSVRLALLREMSNINIAFFDEPTTNLDETRRESLAQQILDIKGFQQLFVISHDDTFEQATDNVVRVQRIDGVSTASTAEQ